MSRRLMTNRQERYIQRQRGAGSRNLNLAFDLELPGVPRIQRSPLKPQKSGRSRRTRQSELPSPLLSKSSRTASRVSSRRTSKATAVRNPSILVEVGTHINNEIEHGATVTDAAECSPRGISSQVSTSVADLVKRGKNIHAPSVRKKRKRRKLIGQQSVRKKAKSTHGSRSVTLPKQQQSSETSAPEPETPLRIETKPLTDTVGQPIELPDISRTGNPGWESLLLQAPSNDVPQRRKRKSIGQDQLSRKKQKLQVVQSAKSLAEAANIPKQQAVGPEKSKPKTLKRNQKTIFGNVSKRKKTSTQTGKNHSENVQQVNSSQSLDKDPPLITNVPSMKKRGRNPIAVATKVDDRLGHETTLAPIKNVTTSSPMRFKGVFIERLPRSQNAIKVEDSTQPLVVSEPELPIILTTEPNQELPIRRESQLKSRSKQLAEVSTAALLMMNDLAVQDTAQETAQPKRRGRPKKPKAEPSMGTLTAGNVKQEPVWTTALPKKKKSHLKWITITAKPVIKTTNNTKQDFIQATAHPENKGGRPKNVIFTANAAIQDDGFVREPTNEIIQPKLENCSKQALHEIPAVAPDVDEASTVTLQEKAAPKKRGRPEKIISSTRNENLHAIPNSQSKAKRERATSIRKTLELPSENHNLASAGNQDTIAEVDAQAISTGHSELVPQARKRGRPKRQDVTHAAAILKPQHRAQKGRAVLQPRSNAPKARSLKLPRITSQTRPIHDVEGDSDDPLSTIAYFNRKFTTVPVVVNILNVTGHEPAFDIRNDVATNVNEVRKGEENPALESRKRAAGPQREASNNDDWNRVHLRPPALTDQVLPPFLPDETQENPQTPEIALSLDAAKALRTPKSSNQDLTKGISQLSQTAKAQEEDALDQKLRRISRFIRRGREMEALFEQENPGSSSTQRQRPGKGLKSLSKNIGQNQECRDIDPDLQIILNEVKGLSTKCEEVD